MKHAAVVLIAIFVAVASGPALGEQPKKAAPAEDTPWSKGVSRDQRNRAQSLLEEGNQHFLAKQYPQALTKYKQAVAQWDHPAIRFNLVRTYINLDRPLEAYTNLEKALRFGAAPLQQSVYAEALNYQKLLKGQIADLTVSCKQAGARVTVDGEPFLTCPGEKSLRVEPGNHQVVGELKGHLTRASTVTAIPGER